MYNANTCHFICSERWRIFLSIHIRCHYSMHSTAVLLPDNECQLHCNRFKVATIPGRLLTIAMLASSPIFPSDDFVPDLFFDFVFQSNFSSKIPSFKMKYRRLTYRTRKCTNMAFVKQQLFSGKSANFKTKAKMVSIIICEYEMIGDH